MHPLAGFSSPSVATLPNVRLPTCRSRPLHLLFVQSGFHQDIFDFLQNRFVFRYVTTRRSRISPHNEEREFAAQEQSSPYRSSARANPSLRRSFPRLSLVPNAFWVQCLPGHPALDRGSGIEVIQLTGPGVEHRQGLSGKWSTDHVFRRSSGVFRDAQELRGFGT